MTGRVVVTAVTLATVAILSGCAHQDGLDYARQACSHVERSLSLYREATAVPPPADAQSKQAAALAEMRAALPLAALAASDSGQWQALRTTLSESSRVSETNLVHALSAQCGDAMSPQAVNGA